MEALRANPLYLLTVLSLLIALAEWLVRRTVLRHVGAALLLTLLSAIVANLGAIPTGSTASAPVPVYDAIFSYVAPISIFWLVLPVNLRAILRAGKPMLALFLIGSAATALGTLLGMRLIDGGTSIGPLYNAIGGMLTGTYSGGSVNFNAVALHYNVQTQGLLYGGVIVVDNIVTAAWMAVTLVMPRLLGRWQPAHADDGRSAERAAPITELAAERETLTPMTLAIVLAMGTGALLLSEWLAALTASWGVAIPSILIITVIALLLAQSPAVQQLTGVRVVGMYAVHLFLAVIGAYCDLTALEGLGALGAALLALATIIIVVHGLLTFGAALAFRLDLDGAAVASQANVGGSTTALALAKSLGREDLILPGILLGALGNGLGTFLGFAVAGWL